MMSQSEYLPWLQYQQVVVTRCIAIVVNTTATCSSLPMTQAKGAMPAKKRQRKYYCTVYTQLLLMRSFALRVAASTASTDLRAMDRQYITVLYSAILHCTVLHCNFYHHYYLLSRIVLVIAPVLARSVLFVTVKIILGILYIGSMDGVRRGAHSCN
jgi:hypothetical protein